MKEVLYRSIVMYHIHNKAKHSHATYKRRISITNKWQTDAFGWCKTGNNG